MQAEADVTTTGVATLTATWDPPASADRYGIEVMTGHGGMHNDPAETLTIRGNNANAIFDFPDVPVIGVPDEEWAAAQTRGMMIPLFDKIKVNSYRQWFSDARKALIKAGWFPPGG